jgi:ABC-type branched-subunit amino acid transport system substrate-binding protein
VVTQVVPFPLDTKIPVVARYQASLKDVAPKAQPGFVSLEGYLVGRTLIAGLEKIDGEPTRKGLIDAVQKASPLDLGGMKLSFSTTSNRGSDQVFLTVIQPDGHFKSVERLQKTGS